MDKRISRAEIFGSDKESSPDPEVEGAFLHQFDDIEFEDVNDTPSNMTKTIINPEVSDDNNMENSGDEFDFPLFEIIKPSKDASRTDNTMSKITLRSPSPEIYIQPERPKSYYFSEVTDVSRQQYQSSAISGKDIISQSTIILSGMKMPWRVINLNAHNESVKRNNKRNRPSSKKRKERVEKRKTEKQRSKKERLERMSKKSPRWYNKSRQK